MRIFRSNWTACCKLWGVTASNRKKPGPLIASCCLCDKLDDLLWLSAVSVLQNQSGGTVGRESIEVALTP
jgi:hypothetical protein